MTDSLLHILAKDFDDIMPAEMQALRNKYREDLGFLGVIPPDKIFNYYLLQKSAKISPLETVLVQPRTFTSSGVFGGRAAKYETHLRCMKRSLTASFTIFCRGKNWWAMRD